jgi:hypothetical protein
MGSKTGEDHNNESSTPPDHPDTLDTHKTDPNPHDESHAIKIEDSTADIKSSRSFTSPSSFVSEKQRFYGRIMTMGFAVTMMLLAQFSVPDHEVNCIIDNVFELLEPLTRFFNEEGSPHVWLRNALQILCSLLMDITFLVTFGYWMFRGRSSRLVISVAMFYVTRALI